MVSGAEHQAVSTKRTTIHLRKDEPSFVNFYTIKLYIQYITHITQ